MKRIAYSIPCGILTALCLCFLPAVAFANTWCLLPPAVESNALDDTSVSTFMMLLQSEIRQDGAGAVILADDTEPDEAVCDAVVQTTLGQLGVRLFVEVNWSGVSEGTAQATAANVDELDVVAAQLATRMTTGRTGTMAQQLGEITRDDAAVDRRIELDNGFALRLGIHTPLGRSFNSGSAGPAIEFGYWAEARDFAMEARTGVRWADDRASDNAGGYLQWNLDLGGYWLPSRGNFSPLLGGGAGLRFATAERVTTETTGTMVQVTQTGEVTESGVGVGLFARAGVMLLRTYQARLSVHMDVEMTTVTMNDQAVQGGLLFGVAAHF